MFEEQYLLIGNSRLHWAKFLNENYLFNHTSKNELFPKDINIKKLIWASVGHYSTDILNQKNELKVKDLKIHNLPSHFGVDRALACFYASHHIYNPFKKNFVIADLGTTLSITKVNSRGHIMGGQLLPGFLTQLQSMEQTTKNLRFPKNFIIPRENFLLSTQEAMLKGVHNALLGAINLSFEPKEDILILCGGDSNLFKKQIYETNGEVIIEPNLVMLGMILHSKTRNKI